MAHRVARSAEIRTVCCVCVLHWTNACWFLRNLILFHCVLRRFALSAWTFMVMVEPPKETGARSPCQFDSTIFTQTVNVFSYFCKHKSDAHIYTPSHLLCIRSGINPQVMLVLIQCIDFIDFTIERISMSWILSTLARNIQRDSVLCSVSFRVELPVGGAGWHRWNGCEPTIHHLLYVC